MIKKYRLGYSGVQEKREEKNPSSDKQESRWRDTSGVLVCTCVGKCSELLKAVLFNGSQLTSSSATAVVK